jgi:hypothetical protein
MQMSRGKALFGLLVVVAAGGAAASGMFGKTEELANWIPPLKWLTGDKAVAQSPQGGPEGGQDEDASHPGSAW